MNNDIAVTDDLKHFFLNLYNGHSGIAERTGQYERGFLHVQTELEDYIKKWLETGKDVILTGSPGDGKTHLLQEISQSLNGTISFSVELDASQKTESEILVAWKQARQKSQPFFVAINHAPLRKLARVAKSDEVLGDLFQAVIVEDTQVGSEIVNFLIYSNEQQQEFDARQHDSFILIDLSHRASITDKQLLNGLIGKLSKIASSLTCSEEQLPPECSYCPIKNNVAAIQNEQVKDRLFSLFELISQQGKRATIRDLLGFLVYSLTRGVECDELWQDDIKGCYDNDYHNLMFDRKARNELFEQFQTTFDPGLLTDTKVDIALWNGTVSNDWIGETPAYIPKSLDELRSLKRRYYFEGPESADEQFSRMLSETLISFRKLLNDEGLDNENIANLVKMINQFYAPTQSQEVLIGYRAQLRLWDTHRYSLGSRPGYFSIRSFPSDKLTLYRPRLNQKYNNTMQIHRDHVLLGTRSWLPGDPALRINWEIFQALSEAAVGKPIDMQPFHIMRRLDLFLRQLGTLTTNYHPIETIEWSNRQERNLTQLRINRANRRFEKV